jgi:integrase
MARRRTDLVCTRLGSPFYQYDWSIAGQRIRGSTGTTDYHKASEIALQLRQQALSSLKGQGTVKIGPGMTLRQACDLYWEDHAQHHAKANTTGAHLDTLERLLGPMRLLSEIDAGAVRRFVTTRRQEVSPASVNRNLSTLRKMLRIAREEWGETLPEVKISKFMLDEPVGREVFLKRHQADQLIAAIIPHARPIVELALLTGLRKGNIQGLHWEMVDLDARRLTLIVKDRSSLGKPLTVPLIDAAAQLLAWLQPDPALRKGPVFTYGNPQVKCPCNACKRQKLIGKRIGDIKKTFETARKAIGMPQLRFHDLRHTVASWLLDKGYPLKVVKEVLGHSDIRTTERYSHLEDGQQAKAMADALGSAQPYCRRGATRPTDSELFVTRLSQSGRAGKERGLRPAETLAGAERLELTTCGFGGGGTRRRRLPRKPRIPTASVKRRNPRSAPTGTKRRRLRHNMSQN